MLLRSCAVNFYSCKSIGSRLLLCLIFLQRGRCTRQTACPRQTAQVHFSNYSCFRFVFIFLYFSVLFLCFCIRLFFSVPRSILEQMAALVTYIVRMGGHHYPKTGVQPFYQCDQICLCKNRPMASKNRPK
jgi:hypothetical protein